MNAKGIRQSLATLRLEWKVNVFQHSSSHCESLPSSPRSRPNV